MLEAAILTFIAYVEVVIVLVEDLVRLRGWRGNWMFSVLGESIRVSWYLNVGARWC